MLAILSVRLLTGFGHHSGGLRHGSLVGLHIVGILAMISATVILAAGAATAVTSWLAKRSSNEDSIKAVAWVTFLLVFVALGWLTLRII